MNKVILGAALAALFIGTAQAQTRCQIVTNGSVSIFMHELAHCNGWTHAAFAIDVVPPAEYVHDYEGELVVFMSGNNYGGQMATMSYGQYDARYITVDESVQSLCQNLWRMHRVTVEATALQMERLAGCSVK